MICVWEDVTFPLWHGSKRLEIGLELGWHSKAKHSLVVRVSRLNDGPMQHSVSRRRELEGAQRHFHSLGNRQEGSEDQQLDPLDSIVVNLVPLKVF